MPQHEDQTARSGKTLSRSAQPFILNLDRAAKRHNAQRCNGFTRCALPAARTAQALLPAEAFICARWLLREVRHAAFAEKTANKGAPQRYRTPTECPRVNGELGARRRTCNVKAAVHRNKTTIIILNFCLAPRRAQELGCDTSGAHNCAKLKFSTRQGCVISVEDTHGLYGDKDSRDFAEKHRPNAQQ